MDEFNLAVSLLTPASDFVAGNPGATFESIFGRAGNDVIYAFDPGANNNDKQNIDFLFGDLFDNSVEEYEIILNIQNTSQGGNPLLILERNIPSVGKDRFILGDEDQPFYTSYNTSALLSTNILGFNEFAVIYDFDPTQDTIQLNGKRKDYILVEVNGLTVQGISQPFYGEAIFSIQQGLPDLVAYVISKPDVDLDLKDKYFQFVGNQPTSPPTQRKIGQLGTNGIDMSLAVDSDSSGNFYLTGSTSGPLGGFNKGYTDVWVAKYNSNGEQLWLKQFGTSGGETAYATVTDNEGNVYVAGDTGGSWFSPKESGSQEAWLAKYDSNGNLLWGKQIGISATGGSNTGFGLDLDPQGNVILSGIAIKENQRLDIFNFSVQDDAWITKFDKYGNQQWLTQIGSYFFDESYDLTVDNNGNAYITGWTQGLVKESDPSRSLLKYDAWLAKVNPTGQVEWIQQFGSVEEGLEFSWGVDTDSQGNIYATGWSTGAIGSNAEPNASDSYDLWLAKFRPDGTVVWVKQFGSQDDDGTYLSDLEIDAQDNIFLTGYSNGKMTSQSDPQGYNAWVARFDTEGNNKWIQEFGVKDKFDYSTGLSVYNSVLTVTGFTEGVLGQSLTDTDSSSVDAWVAQFDVERGKLQKFLGNTGEISKNDDPQAIPTLDISNQVLTDEMLPDGDNIINLTEGVNTTSSVVDYGQIFSGLNTVFDPKAENSFTKALATAVGPEFSNYFNQDTFQGVRSKGSDLNDTVYGDKGNDEVKGGKGIDLLIGVDTTETLAGNGEIDKLRGGDGADTFVLGDSNQVYYNDGYSLTAGLGDYALIEDFQQSQNDVIELHGVKTDYVLSVAPSGLSLGTGIYLIKDQITPELIAVLKDVNILSLSLNNTSAFSFV